MTSLLEELRGKRDEIQQGTDEINKLTSSLEVGKEDEEQMAR